MTVRLLRVVGGPHDGQETEVRTGCDMVTLPNPEYRASRAAYEALARPRLAEPMPPNRTLTYRVKTIRGPNNARLDFLAPAEWSELEAISYLLSSASRCGHKIISEDAATTIAAAVLARRASFMRDEFGLDDEPEGETLDEIALKNVIEHEIRVRVKP